jgi:glycosyltransferase involved in cell wall biosynthesis
MLFAAQKQGADLTIIHAESGLWVGCQLLARGFRIGVDFEDWYSEDIPTLEKINHPFKQLKHFESQLLRKCSYRLATSKVMADGLAAAYGTPRPVCIYNTFPRLERQHMDGRILDRQRGDVPSIVWFSQTIGTGRGLEPFLAALPIMKRKFEIHLRGSIRPEVKSRFLALCPNDWRDCLYFHPTVPNHELLSRLAEHDIGLALEQKDVLSRNLTVTNKLFQYLQAGLAIVATRTAGQAEVLSNVPEVGELTDYEPEKMAAAVNRLLESDNHLSKAKQASLTGFENLYCWERQEPVLVEHAQAALNSK